MEGIIINTVVKAHINLFAVLSTLEYLCELDDECKSLIKDKTMSIYINVKEGPNGTLIFKDGKCTFKEGKEKSDISLYLKSPQHFNDMVDGKATPIPTKGFTKIKFLTNEFSKLTDKLSYYLKPTDDVVKNKEFNRINTILTARVAFAALAVIGNIDPKYQGVVNATPNGVLKIYLENDELEIFLSAYNGKYKIIPNYLDKPRAFMKFKDIETANSILNGKMDSYTAIALEKLELSGHMGIIDNVNKILFVVPKYLK